MFLLNHRQGLLLASLLAAVPVSSSAQVIIIDGPPTGPVPRIEDPGGAPSLIPPFDPDRTNVSPQDRYPRPSTRMDEQRNLLAPELDGGWSTYLGDLHVHARGHHGVTQDGRSLATPNINRDELTVTAWASGYDFFAITQHATSWQLYDNSAPLYRYLSSTHSPRPPDLLALNGVEDYLGPNDRAHFTAFNRLFLFDSDSLTAWHDQLVTRYSPDPAASTHVQLNHPNAGDPWFELPPASQPERRARVRAAVELAEVRDLPTYLELLRRGFRVSPATNSDTHSTFREQEWQPEAGGYMDRHPDGSWVHRYIPTPGVPPERWADTDLGGRTGIVLPAGAPFTYQNLLVALRERRTFRTALPASSGFFVVNQRPMGSEFSLAPDEQRLDFTVWGTTRGGVGGGRQEWRRLEVWSPSQPDRPLKVLTYEDPSLVSLKQRLSLTPYESVYLIRLQQQRPEADVLLAPVWITNPVARPVLSFESTGSIPGKAVCPRVTGGGDALLLQRASRTSAAGEPEDWRTVSRLTPNERCLTLDTSALPTLSSWRVVDAYQEEVTSDTVTLLLRDPADARD